MESILIDAGFCDDMSLFILDYDDTTFRINFQNVKYCIPNSNEIKFDPNYEYKVNEEFYRKALKHLRFFIFDNEGKESRLYIEISTRYFLVYVGENISTQVLIPKKCINSLKQCMDNAFKQCNSFKKIEDETVAINRFADNTKCSVWKYQRPERIGEED